MRKISTLLLFIAIFLTNLPAVKAQVTSSSVFGVISDSKKQPIIGATVIFTYVPTGLKYGTITDDKGYYDISNMNPGGPYTVNVRYIGYQEIIQNDITISLGSNVRFDFTMNEATSEIKEVTVTTTRNKKTAGSEFNEERIQTTPTLSRNITDVTKLTPQSNNNSFAGTNFRYNNVTLDGAINNDAIGFSPSLGGQSGTSNMPGSSTRTTSFSLDAVQEVQVQIAPYDVKLGNFTGGSINAVSRSGSNEVTGSVYGYGRGAFLAGNDAHLDYDKVPTTYYDMQTGFRLGLPLIKNKLFLFTNEEVTRHQEPVFYGAGDANSVITKAQAQQIIDSLQSPTFLPVSPYNKNGKYNPGIITGGTIHSYAYKFFNRIDYIINEKNQLNVRNNTVYSEANNLDNSTQQFNFGNYDFLQKNLNISTVAELKSKINSQWANSLIVGYTFIHDWREPNNPLFPQLQINFANGPVFVGTNREAGIFNMKQNTAELTDNLTWYKHKHKITFGTHNEIYDIYYGFVNSWNGRIDYSNLASFIANQPSRIRAIINNSGDNQSNNDNNSPANFWLMMLSAYAQDEIAVSKKFNVSVGVRIDETAVPTKAVADKNQAGFPTAPLKYGSTYTYPNVTGLSGNNTQIPSVSPRVGFNWDILGNQKVVLRGGSGIFTGRIPFAWYGYTYYNNGSSFNALDWKNPPAGTHIPVDPTSFQQFTDSVYKKTSSVERDVFANNFHMPEAWRSSLAFDFRIPGGVKLTLEGIYTKTIYDVMLQQVNLIDTGVKYYGYDVSHLQPIYTGGKNDASYSSVYLISNTQKGYRYSATVSLEKKFNFGLELFGAYTYGQSKDVLNGIRNSPESGWQLNQATNPNSPGVTFSNFDIRHKIVATVSFHRVWDKEKRYGTTIAFVYTGSSGTPFTWVNSGNKLTNNGQQNDIAYIPHGKYSDIAVDKLVGGSYMTDSSGWNALETFINNNPYLKSHQGQFTDRNGDRTPWNHNLDVRIMQDFNFYGKGEKHHKNTITVSFDIINLTNLLNPNWGLYYYNANTQNSAVYTGLVAVGKADASGKPIYTFTAPTTTPYLVDQIASRWQGQLGLRYTF
jgi:hypothetical protein